MEFLLSFAVFGGITLLAAISPGPDFLVVAKNSMSYSRLVGIATALGVGLGIFVHVFYSIVGLGLIISQSLVLFSAIKFIGAGYLFYLGFKLLKDNSTPPFLSGGASELVPYKKSFVHALGEGFFTNALNPKATLFFLSVFVQVVDPSMSWGIQFLYGLEAAFIVGLWFVILVLLLTNTYAKSLLTSVQHYVLKVMGVGLILLGIKVAFSKS